MLEWRTVAVNACLLCTVMLIAFTATRKMVSTTVPLVVTIDPCEVLEGSRRATGEVKGVQSVDCSSAAECLRQAQQFLSEPSGKRLAQQALEKAVALEPANAEAHKQLASAYLRTDEDNVGHISQEEYSRAESACRTAISLAPNDPEAFLLLGRILNGEVYCKFRSDDSAVEALKKAIELQPEWADPYCALGHAYNLLNRYDEAAAAYGVEAALRRENELHGEQNKSSTLEHSKNHEARDDFVVAQMYTKLGKYDKALQSLQHAASISPADDNIHYWIGKTFLSLGDSQSAKREQELLVELCKSKNKFFITQCQVGAKDLLDAIAQKSR